MYDASPAPASSVEDFWAVIPAGGAGTRLWPLSRASAPKFLHDLTGTGRSLLQSTWDRLAPLCGDHIMVVTGVLHEHSVRTQLPDLKSANLLAEPSPRDSMAAIGLAAAVLERRHPGAVIGSFAADHVIGNPAAFRGCVREAVAVARAGYVVTIGIEPTHPATGFGYIHVGEGLQVEGAPRALAVSEFVEKPDAATAGAWLATGEYRWNAGMFVVRASVLLDELWPSLTKIAIDHAVAEPAAADGRVAVVPGDFGWDDVGDFSSLGSLIADDEELPGVKILGSRDQVVVNEARGLVVPGSGRTVAVLGLDDVVVVDTPDAVLVTTRARAQEVKALVDALKNSGRAGLT
jgi:mannose-1-phosphate guanylyltransferase